METKTTALLGIIFLVFVVGGALALSFFGESFVGQFYEKPTAVESTVQSLDRDNDGVIDSSDDCLPDPLFVNNVCKANQLGESTYLTTSGCCRACSNSLSFVECLSLSSACRWHTGLGAQCFDTTFREYSDCQDYCNNAENAGQICYGIGSELACTS